MLWNCSVSGALEIIVRKKASVASPGTPMFMVDSRCLVDLDPIPVIMP